ncbi:SGNH/GDSL hydrolase family protein, partial [Klebsiella pneumoniae]|nr:SGNH/GDSL hydrolase family protein [Klebsiella pneumoniae]
MSNLQETPVWVSGIYQLTEETPVLGKQEDIPGDGPANLQAQQLANRTQYLKAMMESIADGKEHTFYKTTSDPDGTIAGTQGTDTGKIFRVAQGQGDIFSFKYYLNDSGIPRLVAWMIGQGAISNSIRFYSSNSIAINDIESGNILNGSLCWVISSNDKRLAYEYLNNNGTLEPTGRSLLSAEPFQGLVDAVLFADPAEFSRS